MIKSVDNVKDLNSFVLQLSTLSFHNQTLPSLTVTYNVMNCQSVQNLEFLSTYPCQTSVLCNVM